MTLLTPGPTPVLEQTRQAMALPTIHHRTKEFEEIFNKARTKLSSFMNDLEILFLACSGTGAMEASINALCEKKLLVINSGKFGERFGKIAQSLGKETVEIKHPWDTAASVQDVQEVLGKNPDIDCLAMQICESAGGLRHNYEEIAKLVKQTNPNIFIIADGITAVGVEPLDLSLCDAIITGSQKAFMLPPGLAMIGLSQKAIEKINTQKKGYYFNLANELKAQQKNTTAYTAATTLIIGLESMLSTIADLGLDNFYAQTAKRHKAMIAALKAIGLKIYPKTPALSMATVAIENADEIRAMLKKDFAISIAGGQDDLKNKIFRINNMGLIDPADLISTINAIEIILDKKGIRSYSGLGVKTFSSEFFL